MDSVGDLCRLRQLQLEQVFDTKIDVNRFDTRPMNSVTAKPRIGPVPNWNRNAARDERRDVRVDQRPEHAAEAGVDRRADAALRLELFFDALEDQHVRVDADAHRQHEAGDAGQRHHRADVCHQAEQDDQVEDQRDDGVHAGQPVVDEHEADDSSSPTTDAMTPERIESAPRLGPIVRSSR